jgi:hypothetical protein
MGRKDLVTSVRRAFRVEKLIAQETGRRRINVKRDVWAFAHPAP